MVRRILALMMVASLVVVPAGPAAAAPSAGCDRLNDPAFDLVLRNGTSMSGVFFAGEVLTMSAGEPSNLDPANVVLLVNSVLPPADTAAFPGTVTYEIPADGTYQIAFGVGTAEGRIAEATWVVECDAGGQDTTPPEIFGADDRSVETSSLAGAFVDDGYGVTATDDQDPSPALACDPMSGSLFPLGDTVVTCTATDDSGNSAAASFTVTVVLEATGETLDEVVRILASFGLPNGREDALVARLNAAASALDRGQTAASCRILESLINVADAWEGAAGTVGILTTAQADELRDALQAIIDATCDGA